MKLLERTTIRVTLIVIILGSLVGLAWLLSMLLSPQESTERIVHIQSGDSARSIGKKLQDASIIKSANAFRILAKLRKADRNLKTGTYIFGGKTNLWKTVSRLQEGRSSSIRITFPEGLSLYKSLLRIEASGLASYDSLYAAATDTLLVRRLTGLPLNSLEGFLYPETYLFDVAASPDSILATMTQEFFKKLQQANIDTELKADFYPKLILASIVEKEAGSAKEREIIAGVFANRMRIGMALQSCPTVDYILERRGIKRAVLTHSDIAIPSPYNTYQNTGLPPTPIANPRIESIQAALNPAKHNYLYFFSDRKGNNVFTSSFEEHQRLRRASK